MSMLLQPLVAYVVFSLQSGTREDIKHAVLEHFTPDQISDAKDALWEHCDTSIIGKKINRNDSTGRSKAEALWKLCINWITLTSLQS